MYLKSLVLKGFKSFADRSALALEPGITAVVGPNGSGKSNISDAVLWVLGERNAKNLRGQVMEDVIFAGSSARKSVGVAEVTLVLDNSDGSLPVDFDEVAITRRMYRNGESEYLINNTTARRMDVLDILHDSGLGTGTHSIISQGHLDSILQSKPEDRRALIEEAAGVLKHKQRKAKSQRRLEQMDQHLARVRDVVAEVDRQLGPLQRKARKAAQYEELSTQLADVRLQLAVDDLRKLQLKWDATCATEKELDQKLQEARAGVQQSEAAFEKLQEQIRRESADVAELAAFQNRASSAADRLDSTALLVAEKRRAADARAAELQAMLDGNQAKRDLASAERAKAAEDLEKVRQERAEAQKAADQAQAAYEEARSARKDLERNAEDANRARARVDRDLSAARAELSRTQEALAAGAGRLLALEERQEEAQGRLDAARKEAQDAASQAEDAKSGLKELEEKEQQAKDDLAAKRKERDAIRGRVDRAFAAERDAQAKVRGLEEVERASLDAAGPARAWLTKQDSLDVDLRPLTSKVRVDEGYEPLVERLLGADVTALLVEGSSQAKTVVDALAQGKHAGDVTLLMCGGAPTREYFAPEGSELLLDHLSCDDDCAAAVRALVGDVCVCQSTAQALACHDADEQGLRFIARDGSIVWPSGKVQVRAVSAGEGSGALSRARELEQARKDFAAAVTEHSAAKIAGNQASQDVRVAQELSLKISQDLASMRGRAMSLAEASHKASKQVQRVELECQSIARQLKEEQEKAATRQPQLDQVANRVKELESQVEQAKEQLAAAQEKLGPAREAESQCSLALSEAKLASVSLVERETYAARVVDERSRELVSLAKADEDALAQLAGKQAARKRTEPLMDVLEQLAEMARDRARALAAKVADAQEASTGAHEQANAARQAAQGAHARLDAANESLSQVRVEKGQLEVRVQAAVDAIVHDCGVAMEQALEVPEVQNRAELEESALKLQRRITNLGAINPDAAAEYQELRQRYDYLQSQLQDLADARASLKKINRIIDDRMKDDFINTFHQVNQNFQEIFAVLFPGGTAELTLVDPNDLETTGVEVAAQPKGKRITKMTLMSGGEKSLVACALLFAVYRTRSTPFYILDEIEAALDDSNLRRLTAYLAELRGKTQLIMITHQRRTMEMADVLFGVSMQADGVTKVISQRLEKALAYAE
ncbi:MAG: chromosome segregation protein SMC [Coriobacteriia bacterium]|nr:chromosome segregation protein SMC [Coriobacteriia bacterium]